MSVLRRVIIRRSSSSAPRLPGRRLRVARRSGGCLITLFVLSLLLEGCVIIRHHPYPATWPQMAAATDGQCPRLEGRYRNVGEKSQGEDISSIQPPLLGRLLLGAWDEAATHVDLTPVGDRQLEVTVWNGSTLMRRATVSITSGETCPSGLVEITGPAPDRRSSMTSVGPSTERDSIALSKAADGSLILRRTTRFFGIALLVPVGGDQQTWVRYLSVATSPLK